MMRRLVVMRHAKSSWEEAAATDHARRLTTRGREDALRMGAALVDRGWIPDLVLSSDSQRTRETFTEMSMAFPNAVAARFLPAFYHAGPEALQVELPEVPDRVGCLLVLGHNPGWESAVSLLTGEGVVMTTATAALLSIGRKNWSAMITPGSWALEGVLNPREL